MDGQTAFRELSRMTEEERKGVRLVWIDEEQAENFLGDDYEEKMEFFHNLTPSERGELIENAMYLDGGDYMPEMLDWLDKVDAKLEELIQKKMKGGKDASK